MGEKAKDVIFVKDNGTGALAVDISQAEKYLLLRVELHLSAAPTTSEDFTITFDSRKGTVLDVVYYKRDLSVGSVQDLVIPFGVGYEFDEDDKVSIAYTNTDGNTWGLRVVYELI